jgi:hypothetical protein
VFLSTNRQFIELMERSRAGVRVHGHSARNTAYQNRVSTHGGALGNRVSRQRLIP